jgi:peptidoglycan-associated lipoprotein
MVMRIDVTKLRSVSLAGSLAVSLALAAGCGSKPAAKTAPAAPAAAPAAPAPSQVQDRDFAPKPNTDATVERLPDDVAEINRKGYLKDNFFDFDQAAIRADQREVLAGDASWLKKWPTVKVRVEGHCDERGTAQYNLALGERRAEADREYLASLGIDTTRVELVSYGKERPFAPGHDEGAWAQNRRDHFVVTAR